MAMATAIMADTMDIAMPTHLGWHHGRKVGWRGRGCPPGLWKQGRC
ncbi:hypothetical protein ACVWZR_001781 [Bradyrhizobium sp. i1.3.1]